MSRRGYLKNDPIPYTVSPQYIKDILSTNFPYNFNECDIIKYELKHLFGKSPQGKKRLAFLDDMFIDNNKTRPNNFNLFGIITEVYVVWKAQEMFYIRIYDVTIDKETLQDEVKMGNLIAVHGFSSHNDVIIDAKTNNQDAFLDGLHYFDSEDRVNILKDLDYDH